MKLAPCQRTHSKVTRVCRANGLHRNRQLGELLPQRYEHPRGVELGGARWVTFLAAVTWPDPPPRVTLPMLLTHSPDSASVRPSPLRITYRTPPCYISLGVAWMLYAMYSEGWGWIQGAHMLEQPQGRKNPFLHPSRSPNLADTYGSVNAVGTGSHFGRGPERRSAGIASATCEKGLATRLAFPGRGTNCWTL